MLLDYIPYEALRYEGSQNIEITSEVIKELISINNMHDFQESVRELI